MSKFFKKNFTLLLFTFFIIPVTWSQTSSLSERKVIHWMGIKSFGDTLLPSHKFLYFTGAFFPSPADGLPSYSENFPVFQGFGLPQVYLMNPVYVSLTVEETAVIVNPSGIPCQPQIDVKLVTQRKKQEACVQFFPFRRDTLTGTIQRLESFQLSVRYDVDSKPTGVSTHLYAQHSVLSQGTWYKIGVKYTGIYKLTYTDLQSMGIDPASVNPKNIRIFGNGGAMLPEANSAFRYDDLVENSIQVVGEDDGVFNTQDYILFYCKSPDSWKYVSAQHRFVHSLNLYSDYSFYFLTVDQGPGKRVGTEPSTTLAATHTADRFNDYAFHELDQENLTKSGKIWYGETFDLKNSWELPAFNFPNIDGDIMVRMDIDVAARSTSDSKFKVIVNGGEAINTTVQPISPAFNTDYAMTASASRQFYLNNPAVNVNVNYLPVVSGSVGWLNFVEFNVTRLLSMSGDQMAFRNINTMGTGNITEFTLSNAGPGVTIWEVTDPANYKAVAATVSGNNLVFRLPTDSLREFIAFNGGTYFSITGWTKISNQDLHRIGSNDMIIITHPNFITQANELADIHRNEGLSVLVVTPDLIYNEFSSGSQDITAIRDFVKMIYDRADPGKEPKYLLLFGDGSYDYKNRMENNTNYIPAFQSYNSLRPTESWVTDDYYGLMDADEGSDAAGTLDLGVGRLPVKSTTEADEAIHKIKIYLGLIPQTAGSNYSNSIPRLGDWRNMVCFVADDEDSNMHIDQAEDLASYVDTAYREYDIDKIYFDSYKQVSTPGGQRYPDVTDAINKRVGKGVLIMNYTGHGGETGWAHERVLEVSDINAWNNEWDLPVFVTATCEFSRFDDPERNSAGEWVLLNPTGGGISLFTTTRLSFSSSNVAFNMNFYRHVFEKVNGHYLKMGEVIMMAKTPSNPNIKNFVLLGDPALGIVYPQYNVATSTINGKPVTTEPDTVKAFSKVTVTGFIEDDNGNKMTDFNGILYPTVYDKPAEISTLANDPESIVRTFYLQKNVLYKGKVSVINGDFTFSFIVPRDIAYKYGFGKISYYAQNGLTDANGYYENLVIGGSENNFLPDNEGPSVRLYMNDTNFIFGGMTDQSPILLGFVTDKNGINTVGNGIGHDIVAVLDDNTGKSLVLNDYYESDLDSYQSGTVRFPFSGLSNGLHNLRLKVWDIYNNSAEAYTEFMVVENGQMALDNLLNYPNPFKDHTQFVFNHNQPGTELKVEIRIYSVTGALMVTLNTVIMTDGYKAGPIYWDGRDLDGNRVGKGLYVYRLTISNEKGEHFQKSSKLIVLK